MKKIIYIAVLTSLFSGFTGCKKFLNVTPIDGLAGNNFWKTKADVETFTLGVYNKFRTATMKDSRFFIATGDLRCAPANITNEHYDQYYVGYLRRNDLNGLLGDGRYLEPETTNRFWQITLWTNFYAVVQEANILYKQVGDMPATAISAADKKQYQAEAVFLRCLSYFFMVRVYGDVPYYTNAFNAAALPRTNMVTVLKNCMADLAAVKDDLPWTYSDAAKVGTRAMRGSALILMMHMNMWAAGFDAGNAAQYYQTVVTLGDELQNQNAGAYQLLPIERTSDIFRGGSKEGLFEIVQTQSSTEQFLPTAVYSNYVLLKPFQPFSSSTIWYDSNFMLKLYPATTDDKRKTLWFDINIYASDGTQQMFKFINAAQGSTAGQNQVNNQIVFRYADAILLKAEALAQLDQDNLAQVAVNMIRRRAGAAEFTSTGQALKDDIYYERVRELMGEGQYFYDLVRTRKAVDGTYSFSPIAVDAFNNGAWTWPIDKAALLNNPYITLNAYWN
jgi:hypothetical protein